MLGKPIKVVWAGPSQEYRRGYEIASSKTPLQFSGFQGSRTHKTCKMCSNCNTLSKQVVCKSCALGQRLVWPNCSATTSAATQLIMFPWLEGGAAAISSAGVPYSAVATQHTGRHSPQQHVQKGVLARCAFANPNWRRLRTHDACTENDAHRMTVRGVWVVWACAGPNNTRSGPTAPRLKCVLFVGLCVECDAAGFPIPLKYMRAFICGVICAHTLHRSFTRLCVHKTNTRLVLNTMASCLEWRHGVSYCRCPWVPQEGRVWDESMRANAVAGMSSGNQPLLSRGLAPTGAAIDASSTVSSGLCVMWARLCVVCARVHAIRPEFR